MIRLISIIITWGSHVCYGPLCDVGHEAHDWENDKSGEHTGEGINAADDDGVSEKKTKACHCLVTYPFQTILFELCLVMEMYTYFTRRLICIKSYY